MLLVIAAMAQEVERRLGKAEATGSNPVSSLVNNKNRHKQNIIYAMLLMPVFTLSGEFILTFR